MTCVRSCVCAVKVLVYLTMPVEPDSNSLAEQRSYLQAFKAPLLEGACLGVIVGIVMEPLAAHPDMGEEDAQTVQLVLTLFRNMLRIADPVPTEASGSYHKTRLRVRQSRDLLNSSLIVDTRTKRALLSCATY